MSVPLIRPPEQRLGLAAGIASYAIWGFFPAYFVLLTGVHPLEVVVHRVVWATVALVVCMLAFSGSRDVRRALANHRERNRLGLASFLIGLVWFFYGFGALSGKALDVALGYFICPIVTVLLAVFVKRDRIKAAQWVSTAIGATAVVVVTASYGKVPWISIGVALAFGLYSLVKSQVDQREVSAAAGLTVECLQLFPLVLIIGAVMYVTGDNVFLMDGLDAVDWWLVLSGPLTLLPLLLFAMAATRLHLSLLGNLQYLNPALQMLTAIFVLHERLSTGRLLGFILVWAALAILAIDALRSRKRLGPKMSDVKH